MIFAMDGFEAYRTYVALKNHFSSKTYDFFKYNGRSKASMASFEKRNDKYFFSKLSKHKNLVDFLVANIVYNDNPWVGDVVNNVEAEKYFKRFLKTKESLSYVFKNDLEKFEQPFVDNFIVVDGQHPKALKLYLQNEINLETLIIINELSPYTRSWNKKIEDSIVWPSIYFKCKKLRPFLSFDQEKMKKILVDRIKNVD